jgi:ribosomal protein L11 methyltransferase
VAFDLDPLAPPAALENAVANGVTNGLHLFVGGLDAIATVEFDLVLANLLKSEMLPLAHDIAAHTRPGGCVVLSGLLAGDVEEVTWAFAAVGFAHSGSRDAADATGDRWTALLMRR